jgi:hypothetical protein
MTNPEPAGYVPPPGAPLVTQADRWQWQYRATRALAAILDARPGLPAITWTLNQTGSLAGQVNGGNLPPEVRAPLVDPGSLCRAGLPRGAETCGAWMCRMHRRRASGAPYVTSSLLGELVYASRP